MQVENLVAISPFSGASLTIVMRLTVKNTLLLLYAIEGIGITCPATRFIDLDSGGFGLGFLFSCQFHLQNPEHQLPSLRSRSYFGLVGRARSS